MGFKILRKHQFYSFFRIHLWDLGAGDIYPAHTVQFGDKINSFSLSWETGEPGVRQMLAVGLEEGRVEVMHLKTDYRYIGVYLIILIFIIY